jgi:CHAD domain-containing protein
VRQELKRARAALRLLRESIESAPFREEDAALRQAAQLLANVRDAEVVVQALSRLQGTFENAGKRPNLQPLRRLLLQERRSATAAMLGEPLAAARVLLAQARELTRDWLVSNDLDLLAAAMRRTHRKGRACYRAARDAPTDEHLHAWRRQLKYSAYQIEAVGSLASRSMRKRLGRCTKLAKVLGRDRDFLLLQLRIDDAHLDAASKLRVYRALRRERVQLQRRALRLGKRFYLAGARCRLLT